MLSESSEVVLLRLPIRFFVRFNLDNFREMLNPNVLWAQRDDYIWLTVDVTDSENLSVNIDANKLSFSCESGGKKYGFDIDFFKPINKAESKYLKHRLIDLCLKKEDPEDWPRLTLENKRFPWIKVDWSKWEDSDAEEEADPFDMSKMGGFGDFGGMGGLSGMNPDFSQFAENDSDDEDDLPELEEQEPEGATTKPSEKLIEEVNKAS